MSALTNVRIRDRAITHGMIKVQMMRETISVFKGHSSPCSLHAFESRGSQVPPAGYIHKLACDLHARAKKVSRRRCRTQDLYTQQRAILLPKRSARTRILTSD